jgi:pimeloyl-ACP methyl ester carboxylesterase
LPKLTGALGRLLAASAPLACALTIGAACAHAQAPAPAPCPPGAPSGAQCGSLQLPLDRQDLSRGSTPVAYMLVPRRDQTQPSLGTVLPNPGGPGDDARSGAAFYVRRLGDLLNRRELLLIDPRGTGASGPLACPNTLSDLAIGFSHERLVTASGACGHELGARAGLYGSAAVADDLDDVRAALGIDRVDLFGESYGTYLLPVYAARHPEHVRSIVLAGAYPIAFDTWGRDRLAASRRAIDLVCSRTGGCDGAAALADVARLAERLRRHPRTFAVTVGSRRIHTRLDEGALATILYTEGDSALFGRIPAAVRSALDGDLAPLQRLVATSRMGTAARLAGGSFNVAAYLATGCHDYPRAFSYADSPAARRAAYERARSALDPRAFWPFSPAGWTASGIEGADSCIDWPNDPTAASPLPPGTAMPDVPVLVLSGDLDANTPSAAGREAAAQFPHAIFAEVSNVGHPPTRSRCAQALANRFVETLTADPLACAHDGAPPAVAPRAPLRAAELALPAVAGATPRQRRAVALVLATLADADEQAQPVAAFGAADGLRGGSYVADRAGGVRFVGVRVVVDARVSGTESPTPAGGIGAALRLTGRGVAAGRLHVEVGADGRGQARGVLDGRPVALAFTTS